LKKNEGQCRKFNKDIALHFIAAKSIGWKVLYGNSVLDVCEYGTTCTPDRHDSDDEYIMEQLGVSNRPANISPIKDLSVTCHPCSPLDKEFMDMQKFKYLTKKGVNSVTTTDLKKWIGKCYKNWQVCEFKRRGMVMSLTTY
jgi:hypothetical protein